jgi:glutathione S-transferase
MADLSDARVVLRYFETRGRAQPLRHALAAGGVAFEDVRMSLAEWPSHKGDTTFAGSYGALPTLTWDGLLVAEALPIASFVARRLGHYRDLGDDAITRFEGVCSACYVDVMVRAGELLYADLLYPGADLTRTFTFLVGGMAAKLAGVESIPAPGAWVGGASPVVADFFAAEAFELMSYLLGPDRRPTLREAPQAHDTCRSRARPPRACRRVGATTVAVHCAIRRTRRGGAHPQRRIELARIDRR